MREIFLEITNEYIKQSSTFGGVQGAGNVTAVILCFDKSWDGFAKTLTWFDAYGENPVQQVLGIDKAQDGEGRAYRVAVPPEALKEWGTCSLVIDGYKDHARAKSLTAHFEVEPCSDTSYAAESQDPTPTIAEQLQGEIEDIRETIFKAEESAEAASNAADQAQGYTTNPPYPADKVWYLWNGTEYVKSAAPSVGEQGEKGDKGDTGDTGADGKDGVVDYSLVANALKGSTSGNAIALDDVSPFEHTLGVKARSKNIIPLPYYNESGYEDNGITYTYGADGITYASGTSTAVSRFYITPYDPYLPISVGTYIISIAGTGIDGKNIQLIGNIYSQSKNEYFEIYYDGSRSLIRNIGNGGKFRLYLYIPSGVTLENAEIRVQMEKGTTATEYAPYVEVEQRKVLATGKNLVDIDSMVNDLLADNGNGTYTFTAIADGQGSSDVAQLAIKQGSSITLSFTMVASGGEYNPNSVGMMFDYADGTSERLSVWKDAGYTKTWTATKDIAGVEFHHYGGSYGKWFTIKDLQIEYGEAKTAYEKFKGITEYSVNADGTVDGVQSISPNMTLLTDTSGVVLDVQYNKDINKTIETLTQAIASLGGNV